MNCLIPRFGMTLLKAQSSELIRIRSRLACLSVLLWLVAFVPGTINAETESVEIRRAVEAAMQQGNQQRSALSQVVAGLIRKYGDAAVGDAAIGPLIAGLKGTNYQTRQSVAWALVELKDKST